MTGAQPRPVTDPARDNEWKDKAACLAADPELFHPAGWGADYAEQIAAAKAVCQGCGVLDMCTRAAEHEPDGIWAGRTPAERTRIRNGTKAPDHGTPHGYRKHRRAREAACEECRAAESADRAARKARAKAS